MRPASTGIVDSDGVSLALAPLDALTRTIDEEGTRMKHWISDGAVEYADIESDTMLRRLRAIEVEREVHRHGHILWVMRSLAARKTNEVIESRW